MPFYQPGREPEKLKKKMAALFEKLNSAYPDKNIVGLYNNHRKLGETVTELYRELGYPTGKYFLKAYGYQYEDKKASGGRKKTVDAEAIIKELQKRYPKGSGFTTAEELFDANPDLATKKKTISNTAKDVFGMPLSKYLLSIGLIQSKDPPKVEKKVEKKKEKKKNFIICKVFPTGVKNPVYCIATSKSIQEGDVVEVPLGSHDNLAFALVKEVINYDEDSAPCDVRKAKTINRKLSVREYTDRLLWSILSANAAIDTDKIINNTTGKTFTATNHSTVKVEGNIAWACCRGLSADIMKVLEYLVEKDSWVYEYNDLIFVENGISELFIFEEDVLDVLAKFPEIKMVMFSENSQSGMVRLCYSKSGYATVTDTYEIGKCDITSKSRWTLRYSPTESFKTENIEYTFNFSNDWESLNYVFTDEIGTRKQLGK